MVEVKTKKMSKVYNGDLIVEGTYRGHMNNLRSRSIPFHFNTQ
jgi:hypothetical protein